MVCGGWPCDICNSSYRRSEMGEEGAHRTSTSARNGYCDHAYPFSTSQISFDFGCPNGICEAAFLGISISRYRLLSAMAGPSRIEKSYKF